MLAYIGIAFFKKERSFFASTGLKGCITLLLFLRFDSAFCMFLSLSFQVLDCSVSEAEFPISKPADYINVRNKIQLITFYLYFLYLVILVQFSLLVLVLYFALRFWLFCCSGGDGFLKSELSGFSCALIKVSALSGFLSLSLHLRKH